VLRVAIGRPHCPSPVALSSAVPNGSPQPTGKYLLSTRCRCCDPAHRCNCRLRSTVTPTEEGLAFTWAPRTNHGPGRRSILGRISKRGGKYLRTLLIRRQVLLMRPNNWARYSFAPWLKSASERLHRTRSSPGGTHHNSFGDFSDRRVTPQRDRARQSDNHLFSACVPARARSAPCTIARARFPFWNMSQRQTSCSIRLAAGEFPAFEPFLVASRRSRPAIRSIRHISSDGSAISQVSTGLC